MTATTATETKPKKALSRQDQRNLEKLIDSDFRDAANSLQSAASAHVRAAQEQLEAEHAELEIGAHAVLEEIQAFEKDIREQWRIKVEDIMTRGYEVVDERHGFATTGTINLLSRVQPKGKQAALRKIQEDANYAQNEAHRTLDSARNRALRGVYVAGISGQAGLDLLDAIPTAADAFAAALPKHEPKAVEA